MSRICGQTGEKDHASEGLPCIPPVRNVLHGLFGRVGNASHGCEEHRCMVRSRCWRSAMCRVNSFRSCMRAMRWWEHSKPGDRGRTGAFIRKSRSLREPGDNAAAAVGTGTVGAGQMQPVARNERHALCLQ